MAITGRFPLWAVLALYFAIYASLIVKSDFLPYVMDNNESFSSLWHAANLYNFGVEKSWGLADEAFSPHAAAHPYVHTHQGNFPRLFALLIYALGARTIEAQIAVTTFTAGLAAIFLVYAFFARVATPVFAAVVCVVFMTDYVLFAQWQVVTYRVWYCFLFFFCLYSVHRASEDGSGGWITVTAAAFACLFYFELVFAAFVAVLCGLYALYRCAKAPKRFLTIGLAQAGGATLALAVVIAQAVAYLGFDDFRRDIYLTFVARNDFSSDASLLAQAAAFYESRKVIFWSNIQDRAGFTGLLPFLRSFTSFDWRIHTPLLAYVTWVLAAGWLLSLLATGARPVSRRIIAGIFFGALIIGLFALLPSIQGVLFDPRNAPIWEELQRVVGPRTLGLLVVMAAGLVAAYVIAGGAASVLGSDDRAQLRGVLAFLVCGALAYALVYALSPGYIYSGYLYRHAPFTVFLTDVVVALAFYVAAKAGFGLAADALDGGERPPFATYIAASLAGVAALLTVFLAGYWVLVQATYVKWMPPTHYAFLKKLAEPPYRGASFVVNNYAAPVASYTGQWAYFDPVISQAYVVPKGESLHLAGDRKYLWFADRDSNASYRKPDYFLCMIAQSPFALINRLLRERGTGPGEPGCSALPLVRLAKDGDQPLKGIKLVDYDRTGLEKIGFDSWAIVKLEWDDSPGGTVLDWSIKPVKTSRESRDD